MKGSLIVALQHLVTDRIGEESWRSVVANAGFPPNKRFTPLEVIEDDQYYNLIRESSRALRLPMGKMWEVVADHWINEHTHKHMSFYYRGPENARDFLLQMNAIHSAVDRASTGTAQPPRFEFHSEDDGSLLMTYQSSRGLMQYFTSLVKAVGKFYKENLIVRQVGDNQVRITFMNNAVAGGPSADAVLGGSRKFS